MSKRYRLKLATWTVHREPGQPSPRLLSSPEAVTLLARDLLLTAEDDKEHFWAIYLNAQNHYLMHTLVSTGTLSASLVHPGRFSVRHSEKGPPASSSSTIIRPEIPFRPVRIFG